MYSSTKHLRGGTALVLRLNSKLHQLQYSRSEREHPVGIFREIYLLANKSFDSSQAAVVLRAVAPVPHAPFTHCYLCFVRVARLTAGKKLAAQHRSSRTFCHIASARTTFWTTPPPCCGTTTLKHWYNICCRSFCAGSAVAVAGQAQSPRWCRLGH